MTAKQTERLNLFTRFYKLQKAIDQVTDPKVKEVLEAQKKEIQKKLE